MAQACPYCRSVVNPVRNAQGLMVCPACQNTGRVGGAPPPPYPSYAPPPGYAPPLMYAQPPRNAPSAVASMVLGIVGIFPFYFLGWLLGTLAVFFGVKAKRQIRQSGGRLQGDGMATAGIVTGAIGIAFGVLAVAFFVVVFVLAGNFANADRIEDSAVVPAGDAYWQGFEVYRDNVRVTYTVEDMRGHDLDTGIYVATSFDDPEPVSSTPSWAQASGNPVTRTVTLDKGVYVLEMGCMSTSTACDLEFTIRFA